MLNIHFTERATCVFLAGCVLLLGATIASGVVLDEENRLTVVLDDGTQVHLLGESTSSSGRRSNKYYYLPVNLRLTEREDKTPEFLFTKYVSEKTDGGENVSGALLHFLMTYGLTPDQEKELKQKLDKDHNKAELLGAVRMEDSAEAGSFKIISGTLGDSSMTPSLITSGKAPLMAGQKIAVASRLSSDGAQLLSSTFEKTRSITDVSVALDLAYSTLAPAARGRIVFDWNKLETHSDTLEAEYKKTQVGSTTKKASFLGITIWKSTTPEYAYSYDEMRSQFDFLSENKVVRLEFDELVADERVSKIREAFFQYFLNAFAEESEPGPGELAPPGEKEKEQMPDIKQGRHYKYKKTSIQRSVGRKTQVFDLGYRMTLKWPYQLVGNLASWYDGVRHNAKCVGTVILNDPFFQHRDINFILDLDARELFSKEINYVTVNVKKRRDSGRDFQDHITIDEAYVNKHGVNAQVRYARGEDKNADVYEYQAQWSLRGGEVYPKSPPWQKGVWEGVTLSPPVVPRLIEVEADLSEMAQKDITRATVQVCYRKFGREAQDNIQLSVAKGEPMVSKTIFTDRGEKGYAYRLIVNHKTEGKLVLPWQAQVGDNYVYAQIPPELIENEEFTRKAKEAGEPTAGAETNVLKKFEDLF